MRNTMFDQIINRNLVKKYASGEMVLKLNRVWCHEITTPNAILDMEKRGVDVVFDSNNIKAMIDHVNPAKDTASAIQGQIVREWSRKHGIEFLDVGRNGVCHAIIPEKGWIEPGDVGIMGDSHTCTHGAFGAFAAGVGTSDLENGIITGLWICPPQKVIRVNFTGRLPANVFAKDLVLSLISQIGVKGATNAVLEFRGNVIDDMGMEGRMTIANMAVEAGATSGMMMVDKNTITYLWPSLRHKYRSIEHALAHFSEQNSGPNAEYDQVVDIDVTNLAPLITVNYSPGDVTEVAGLAGVQVNQVYIGSCTNGRMSDLHVAANIIEKMGGKIADNIRCVVVPATQRIYEQALKKGLIDIFVKAGCFVSGPTCGACLGMSCGVIAPGEVCVSTTNRNFLGRMGKGGMVHLVSPATAAVTAVRGVITKPSIELCLSAIPASLNAYPLAGMHSEPVCPTGWESKMGQEEPDYAGLLLKIGGGTEPDFSGKAFYLPNANVDTDQIIPAKYLTETNKAVFGQHCLEDAPIDAVERPKIYQSQILVAGENFGCGSSREHAAWALEAAGIRCVIAPSFARIFENNMFANGLPCIELPKKVVDELLTAQPDRIKIDFEKDLVSWWQDTSVSDRETNVRASANFTISDYHRELVKNGGGLGFMLKLAAAFYSY
jgi:3-isopropylmalate/(R)-2-methylmalate dehydratase large subunit